MRSIHILSLLVVLFCSTASAQIASPTKENPTPEQLAALNGMKNTASPLQGQIKQALVVLEVYQKEQGRWPESWAAVESNFDFPIWESPEVRQSFTKTFVLLRGVEGHINTREEGEYDATMMMVMAAPIERKFGQDKHELGRWAVWKTFRGQIVTRWHPESEIASFSSWPDVQSLIAHHIKTVGNMAQTPKTPQPNKATPVEVPPTQMRTPEAKLTTTPSDEPTSSTPQSIIVLLILAGCGLLWLLWLLCKRRY